jgi:hypothetical protein
MSVRAPDIYDYKFYYFKECGCVRAVDITWLPLELVANAASSAGYSTTAVD